jgi:hypothetical protein
MKSKKALLAYCGIYCGDCLGYTGVIADAAKEFMTALENYKFDRTVKCVLYNELEDYDKFSKMLKFMSCLKCPQPCREREDSAGACPIRKCCTERRFYACYECNDFENCDKLKSFMKGLHAEACVENLKAIKEMGLDAWIRKGKRHHYWDKPDK